jgi:hypothetical protein
MARRDKSAIKILCIFKGESFFPTRITDIKHLGLPHTLETKVKNIFHPNRLLWEIWLEGAKDSTSLKKNLVKRGYKDLPLTSQPVLSIQPNEGVDIIKPDFSKLEIKKEIMLQRNY